MSVLHRTVDLRSDTVTRPGAAMCNAMITAPLGDACYGEDPTVNRLERVIAERLGKEAALFVPTGTMGNQLGLAAHTRPGDGVLCHDRAHVARWEGAGGAANSGVQLMTVAAADGLPTVADLEAVLPPRNVKAPRMTLLALENTHNAAGGVAHGPQALGERTAWARSHGLACHLDGARLFNAAIARGVDVVALAATFDTVNVCFSKGLGAPVGSALAGGRDAIALADRVRHRLGGGWRQAGVLAAAALYALEHNVARLADDHARARLIAEALERGGVARPLHAVETNLVVFGVDPAWGTAQHLVEKLAARGILVAATGPDSGRLVTHLDVDDADVAAVCEAVSGL